jgi:hypothetical protein
VSEVAVLPRLSKVVPSPQFTVIPVTFVELETVNVTVIVVPVLLGFGVGAFTATVGTLGVWTVTEPAVAPLDPLLSVTVIVTVNTPAEE